MDLPPLFFKGDYAYGRDHTASIDYAVEYPLMGVPKGAPRNTWRIGILGCLGAQDVGPSCFCAHCCCGLFTLNAAQKLVPNVEGENTALTLGIVAQALQNDSNNPSRGGSVAGSLAQVGAILARAEVRRQVFQELYGRTGGVETAGTRYFYTCCCAPCAIVQEVDGIQTWAKEVYGHPLVYGPIGFDCACCQLQTVTGIPVTKIPYPKEWDGLAPAVPTMAR